MGLVSVILGTASGAQQVGLFGAIGVGGYVALAGLWASPLSGASMNPARTFGPDLVSAWTSPTTGSTWSVPPPGRYWLSASPGCSGGRAVAARRRRPPRARLPEILHPDRD